MAQSYWEKVKGNVAAPFKLFGQAKEAARNYTRGKFQSSSPSFLDKPGTSYAPYAKKPDGTPYAIGPKAPSSIYGPTAPKPIVPASPKRQADGSVGSVPASVGAPANFNYSQVPSASSPSTANTAISGAGMSSSDPATMERIRQMMEQTYQGSSYGTQGAGAQGSASGQTITPSMVSAARKALEDARARVQSLSSMSQSERDLADQLAKYQGESAQAIAGLEGQGRGLTTNLVRGQQAQLQEQTGLQEQTLLGRLSAAQQARNSELMAAQLGLQGAEADYTAEQEAQRASAPIEIGGNLVQLNPQTGQYETVYQSPASTEAQKPITVSAGQTVIDPATGQIIFQAGDKPEAMPSAVQEYMYAVQQGYVGDFNSYKNQTTSAQKVPSAEMLKLQSNVQSGIDSLTTLEGLLTQNQGVFGRPLVASGTYKAAEQNLIDIIGRLRSGGAITTDEANRFKTLLPQRFDTQRTVEYKLGQLRSMLESTMSDQSTVGGDAFSSPEAQNLRNAGFSDEEIAEYLGFGNVPSTTQNGSAQAIANAIKQVESGGNYNAKGGSGEGGAYQFMPATWKGWAGKYLGNANAAQTPANQDKVAVMRIQEWLDQGYTPEMIALSWNAGSPVRRSGVNKYGVKYDSGAYADKVLNALG